MQKELMFLLFSLSVQAQQLGTYNLSTYNISGQWLMPKGEYAIFLDDGPGVQTEKIVLALRELSIRATFNQNPCQYFGQVGDPRSANCKGAGTMPTSLITLALANNQCIGNHGWSHLALTALSPSDALKEIGNPIAFFSPFFAQTPSDCPFLFTAPGYMWNSTLTDMANNDPGISGKMQGPVGADFTGSGTIGNDSFGNDQACMIKHTAQECADKYLAAIANAQYGGIIKFHDFNPYCKNINNLNDPCVDVLSLIITVIEGCSKTLGIPCTFVGPDAVPGVRNAVSVTGFNRVSDDRDDFSDRISKVLVGDINGDGFTDAAIARQDGLWCATAATYDGRLYRLQPCLSALDSAFITASPRWLTTDSANNRLPMLVWFNQDQGIMGAKANGSGVFDRPQLLSSHFSAKYGWGNSTAARFGIVRLGTNMPDALVVATQGIELSLNNGQDQFGAPIPIPSLIDSQGWTPQQAAPGMMLVDINHDGLLDVVIPGDKALLYALALGNGGFSQLKPLLGEGGFNHWPNPGFCLNLTATFIHGETAIVCWTSYGFAYSGINPQSMTTRNFSWICNDCFVGLSGWLNSWRQSDRTVSLVTETGFAYFQGKGKLPQPSKAAQPYLLWKSGIYVSDNMPETTVRPPMPKGQNLR